MSLRLSPLRASLAHLRDDALARGLCDLAIDLDQSFIRLGDEEIAQATNAVMLKWIGEPWKGE